MLPKPACLLCCLAGLQSISQAVEDIFDDDDHSSVDSDHQQLEVTDAGTIITGSVPSVCAMWVLGRPQEWGVKLQFTTNPIISKFRQVYSDLSRDTF